MASGHLWSDYALYNSSIVPALLQFCSATCVWLLQETDFAGTQQRPFGPVHSRLARLDSLGPLTTFENLYIGHGTISGVGHGMDHIKVRRDRPHQTYQTGKPAANIKHVPSKGAWGCGRMGAQRTYLESLQRLGFGEGTWDWERAGPVLVWSIWINSAAPSHFHR